MKVNLELSEREAKRFFEKRKQRKITPWKNIPKRQQGAMIIGGSIAFGFIVIMGLLATIHDQLNPPQPIDYTAQDNMSWGELAHYFTVRSFPILLIALFFSWIIHGVQVRLLA